MLVLDMEVIYEIYVEQEAMMANLWLMESLRALVRVFPLFFVDLFRDFYLFLYDRVWTESEGGFICGMRHYTFILPWAILCNYATKLNTELR